LQTAKTNQTAATSSSFTPLNDIGFKNAAANAIKTGPTTNNNINITGINLSNAAATMEQVTNGIKYGSAVTVNTNYADAFMRLK
jgi:hypothetical protein